jgi:hypothetical protein
MCGLILIVDPVKPSQRLRICKRQGYPGGVAFLACVLIIGVLQFLGFAELVPGLPNRPQLLVNP